MAQVIWTEPALDDLEAIAGYITLDKPGATQRLVQQVFGRVEHLALFSQSGGKPRELSGTPYRQLVNRLLRLFYRVGAEKVYIIYVMRGEQPFRLRNLLDHE